MKISITTSAICFLTVLFICGCTNLEDATSSDRSTFIRIYEGPSSFRSTDLLVESDGYLILGNMQVEDDSIVTVLIKTDKSGNQIGETKFYEGGSGKSIKPFENASFSGYLVLGDRIKVDPNADPVGNILITSSRLLAIENDLTMYGSATIGDTSKIIPGQPALTDFYGHSLTITDDGRVVLINSYKPVGGTERPFVIVLKQNFSFTSNPYEIINSNDIDWYDPFLSIEENNLVGKSVHYYNNNIIWASSVVKQQGSFEYSYIAVTRIPEPLAPSNASSLEFSTDKRFTIEDIQPASSLAFGFGVVGTLSEIDGSQQNMFFCRVDANGSILTSDTLFVDASLSKTASTTSAIEDTGEAISSTSDGGFVLAGTMLTTSIDGKEIGNGAHDIFLVKVNAFSEIVWTKILGGAGDELVSSIRETPDGGLLISGTNNVGGYSSIFLIKTNKNGELKN